MNPSGRVAVRVTKDALRHVRGGHPWIFDGSVESVRPDGRSGDVAVIFDDRNRFAAVGLYDPDSPIRVRVLQAGAQAQIGREFFVDRLDDALRRRASIRSNGATNAFRWVHGENDGLAGLVLDRYDRTVVLKAYTAAWFPHLDDVVAAVGQVDPATSIVLRLARNVTPAGGLEDGAVLLGAPPTGPVGFRENGLRFEADVIHGHKTGHFLDQRENRMLVRSLAKGADVLDVYACNGGFSVNAAAGGARSVHSVDISAAAIDAAEANMVLNRSNPAVSACQHIASVGDAFHVMADLAAAGRRYDMVVLDPPSFASRGSQLRAALDAHTRAAEAALTLLGPGGILVQSCCSSRVDMADLIGAIHRGAGRRRVVLAELDRSGQPQDHPATFPEGRYLTTVVHRVEPVRK